MGDAGRTFLGLGVGLGSFDAAITHEGAPWSREIPLCVLTVPCYDMTAVVLLRLCQGRSPFHGNKEHLSPRLVAAGLTAPRAVLVLYLLALASGAASLLLYIMSTWTGAGLVLAEVAVWWIALAVLDLFLWRRWH